MFQQICEAIRQLHSLNILHRDIKPENILLDENLNAKICDFGWSVMVSSEMPQRDTFCGTLEYIAPEMYQGGTYDSKADIWALGILLYEMLHGCSPFKGKSLVEISQNIRKGDIHFSSLLSEDIRQLIKGILRNDPEQRLSIEQIFLSPLFAGEKKTIVDPSPIFHVKSSFNRAAGSRKPSKKDGSNLEDTTDLIKQALVMELQRKKESSSGTGFYNILARKKSHSMSQAVGSQEEKSLSKEKGNGRKNYYHSVLENYNKLKASTDGSMIKKIPSYTKASFKMCNSLTKNSKKSLSRSKKAISSYNRKLNSSSVKDSFSTNRGLPSSPKIMLSNRRRKNYMSEIIDTAKSPSRLGQVSFDKTMLYLKSSSPKPSVLKSKKSQNFQSKRSSTKKKSQKKYVNQEAIDLYGLDKQKSPTESKIKVLKSYTQNMLLKSGKSPNTSKSSYSSSFFKYFGGSRNTSNSNTRQRALNSVFGTGINFYSSRKENIGKGSVKKGSKKEKFHSFLKERVAGESVFFR